MTVQPFLEVDEEEPTKEPASTAADLRKLSTVAIAAAEELDAVRVVLIAIVQAKQAGQANPEAWQAASELVEKWMGEAPTDAGPLRCSECKAILIGRHLDRAAILRKKGDPDGVPESVECMGGWHRVNFRSCYVDNGAGPDKLHARKPMTEGR